MIEAQSERLEVNNNDRDRIKSQVSSNLLKLFFMKELRNSKESPESDEININIKGSLKGPDQLGNYVMSFDGKKILLDENLNDITGLEFVSLMPYNDRYYICDLGKKCVFYDIKSGNVVEFKEYGNDIRAINYKTKELSDDEFLTDLCKKFIPLYPGQSIKSLALGFDVFLKTYHERILRKDIDAEERANEASEFGNDSQTILHFLRGAYEYMYSGKITKYLAGKGESKVWTKLKKSEILKELYPDLYLSMNELDSVKNVFLSEDGDIGGYITVREGSCYVALRNGKVFEYDGFRGPDKFGNVITRKNDKEYFIGTNFKYPNCGFDEIIGPDVNDNYILRKGDKKVCLVRGVNQKVFNIKNNANTGNEPNNVEELFDCIDGPDANNNYIINGIAQRYLLNGDREKISKGYLNLYRTEDGRYRAVNIGTTTIIDKNLNIVSVK